MQPTNTASNSVGLILLPGAGMGSWIWQDTIKKLQVPAVAADFPKSNSAAGIQQYVDAALEQAAQLKTDKIIVVGHSISGAVGLRLAAALGSRLAGFVGVAAAIPQNEGSFVSSLPFPQKFIMPLIIRLAGTKPPEASIRASYCNDLDKAVADQVITHYQAEPKQLYFDKSAPIPTVPKLYIKTTKDTDFTPSWQDKMSKNLKADKVVSIDSGHLPMLAKPAELAASLNEFAQSVS